VFSMTSFHLLDLTISILLRGDTTKERVITNTINGTWKALNPSAFLSSTSIFILLTSHQDIYISILWNTVYRYCHQLSELSSPELTLNLQLVLLPPRCYYFSLCTCISSHHRRPCAPNLTSDTSCLFRRLFQLQAIWRHRPLAP
jgi:hypothetical protein